jgi:magnesium-protoporphyrin IX monomethyl ester (oxidative) cyclase
MKILLVHPSALLYAEVYLRLEPLGVECVAAAARAAGHNVRLLDLQVFPPAQFALEMREFRPDAVGFSLNYLANAPEVIDMAKLAAQLQPGVFVFVGGHSGSFVAQELLNHSEGAINCIVRGEAEVSVPEMLAAVPRVSGVPGIVTLDSNTPPRKLVTDFKKTLPARDLTRRRRKYFIGSHDPCASIEFSRGCPWDCSFCSAWTFYGRSYRQANPEVIAEEIATIREPSLFVVDDVAFVRPEHGMAVAEQIERRGIRKRYYLETRCDTLIRNKEVFARWVKLGLDCMFLGFESLDAEQLKRFRKRLTPGQNFEALEIARKLKIIVAINLIVDPGWDREQFAMAREWATQVPEVVHMTIATPYPGTELFHTETRELSSTDYRLFDIQHAVLPTKLPLREFYEELVRTQAIINSKFMGWRTALDASRILVGLLLKGQTNFLRMLFRFSQVYNAQRFHEDHSRPVRYEMNRPVRQVKPTLANLMVHAK